MNNEKPTDVRIAEALEEIAATLRGIEQSLDSVIGGYICGDDELNFINVKGAD